MLEGHAVVAPLALSRQRPDVAAARSLDMTRGRALVIAIAAALVAASAGLIAHRQRIEVAWSRWRHETDYVLTFRTTASAETTDELETTASMLQGRLDHRGIDAVVWSEGSRRIVVALPALDEAERRFVDDHLGATGRLEYFVGDVVPERDDPRGPRLGWPGRDGDDGPPRRSAEGVVLEVEDSGPTIDASNRACSWIAISEESANALFGLTTEAHREASGLVWEVDGRTVGGIAEVRPHAPGRLMVLMVRIARSVPSAEVPDRARDLAALLRWGPLPVPIEVESQRGVR